jgi:hypothetical protein
MAASLWAQMYELDGGRDARATLGPPDSWGAGLRHRGSATITDAAR